MPQYDRSFFGIPLPGADLVPTQAELEAARQKDEERANRPRSTTFTNEDGEVFDWSDIY